MKLNVIHIKERVDRWKILQSEFDSQNIFDYRIWDGIVDSEMPERGISKAHKRIVKFAKENCWPEVLIEEDDLHFTDKEAFRYFLEHNLYISQCQSPKAVVLCENLHFLKMPGKPRENHIELWYAGGRNIEKLDYSTHRNMPIYYSCDWDYDGLDIFGAVKEKFQE